MEKSKSNNRNKRLLALCAAGLMVGTATGCTNQLEVSNENEVPTIEDIPSSYSDINDFYKYAIKNGEAVKIYNSKYVYLFFNKETYEASEYIYKAETYVDLFGTGNKKPLYYELYDLLSEEMVAYRCILIDDKNSDYYDYLIDNNYLVCLANAGDYIEGFTPKRNYTIDEIRELEPQIAEGLKIINSVKIKTKVN